MVPCSILAIACALLGVFYLRTRRRLTTLQSEINGLRAIESQQEEALSRLAQLDKIKDEFISTVSHELRTPLTSIRGALGLLGSGLMGSADAKAQNLLRIAVTNTDRLVRLINDILDLERMESGRAPLHFRRCALDELVHQSVETMAAMADSAGVRIQVAPTLTVAPIGFDGDPDRILQVLTNLLSNAIKFSPIDSTIHIDARVMPDSLLLNVSDEGRGIPVDKLHSIFDRFQQVESSDARQKGGTGLGLAICRTIVHQHGGHIWATPNPTAGVTLSVEFPRSIATALLAAETLGPSIRPWTSAA